GLVLDVRDPAALRGDVGAGGDERQELLRALDRQRGVLLEEVEEAGLAGQEPTEHAASYADRVTQRRLARHRGDGANFEAKLLAPRSPSADARAPRTSGSSRRSAGR